MTPKVVAEVTPAFLSSCSIFFFNDTATTEIYTLSLHDALPICARFNYRWTCSSASRNAAFAPSIDRKSTRLNSSHGYISYAVFCLKKQDQTAPREDERGAVRSSDHTQVRYESQVQFFLNHFRQCLDLLSSLSELC